MRKVIQKGLKEFFIYLITSYVNRALETNNLNFRHCRDLNCTFGLEPLMSMPSSNMVSKNYCPNCGGFDLVKLHRSFIQKRILDAPNKLYCQSCALALSVSDFSNNPAKEIPVFIGGSIAADANDRSIERYRREVDHSQKQTSSQTVDEIATSEGNQITMRVKKKKLSAWWLYFSGVLVICLLSLLGYKYMSDYSEHSANKISNSIGPTFSSQLVDKVDENKLVVVPQLQIDVIVESEDVLKSIVVAPLGSDIIVSESETIPSSEAVLGTPKLMTEVVEKLHEPVVVPKIETEISIVLPFNKESEHLVEEAGQSEFGERIRSDDTNELMERATLEFLRHDLDKLLTEHAK